MPGPCGRESCIVASRRLDEKRAIAALPRILGEGSRHFGFVTIGRRVNIDYHTGAMFSYHWCSVRTNVLGWLGSSEASPQLSDILGLASLDPSHPIAIPSLDKALAPPDFPPFEKDSL